MGYRPPTGKSSRYVTATEVNSAFYPQGAVKLWVSAYRLSNNNKWRWWIRFTGCLYRRACRSSRLAWSKGWRPSNWRRSAFNEWTLGMARLRCDKIFNDDGITKLLMTQKLVSHRFIAAHCSKYIDWLSKLFDFVVVIVFVEVTLFKKPKAPSFQIGSGWNLARLFCND